MVKLFLAPVFCLFLFCPFKTLEEPTTPLNSSLAMVSAALSCETSSWVVVGGGPIILSSHPCDRSHQQSTSNVLQQHYQSFHAPIFFSCSRTTILKACIVAKISLEKCILPCISKILAGWLISSGSHTSTLSHDPAIHHCYHHMVHHPAPFLTTGHSDLLCLLGLVSPCNPRMFTPES
ncbi:uncharacterized protein BO95DRAFT_81816 [Aspergillus brunneoviolaceus CBS 621.78]|uniref:Uncharacterized protein n=1 Tax=Aspergillus brunneoviolaceus CBS 621.78 TaxID=1450534 RepID=A0ACD1GES3_9EURO|nr:hypothetical protein BO95DRAFT_81816 [Aspergillus brunneoviolaceus CBS 621.78]RAH47629.1 hypothetical protein BO95DRAFT_81816 [Aspergillus brunneoviolaceus CBS 621.78]